MKIVRSSVLSGIILLGMVAAPAHSVPKVPGDGIAVAIDAFVSLGTGTLRDSGGAGVSGVEVKLFAFPNELSREVGASFSLTEIASATSGADGSFHLTPDLSKIASELNLNGDAVTPVNVSIVAVDDEVDAFATTTMWVERGAKEALFDPEDLATLQNDGVISVQGEQQEARFDLTAREKGPVSSPAPDSPVAPLASGCTLVQNYGKKHVTIGQLSNIASSGFTQRLEYTHTSSSSLGVGVSNSGNYGTFSASGTTTYSTSASVGLTHNGSGSRQLRTEFVFGKYMCSYGTVNPVIKYEVRPSSYAGGSTYISVSTPSAVYCVNHDPGTDWALNSSVAHTFAAGVKLSSAIGIDLSSRSGYSASVKILYTFSQKRTLCGTAGNPGGVPRLIVVKS